LCDWGGGLIWLSLAIDEAGPDGGAGRVRAAVATVGGHAMLVRAPAEMRETAEVFEALPGPLAALSARVKAGFDPRGTLNPGRMWKGA
jgi:glycolate oxidase FAD binding subunit